MKQEPQPKKHYKIGVDLMGSDHSPAVLLKALDGLPLKSGVEILAIGTPEFATGSSLPFHPAPDFVSMDENPLTAFKKKKEASIFVGLRLLKQGKIDAFVSAGNTGALVTGAKVILSTIPGISRPALMTFMPTKINPVAVLDVGANIQYKAKHLVQFTFMAANYLREKGNKMPRIGLLNIGSEALKGTSELRQAYHILQHLTNPPFCFAGNIEGKTVFDGDVDALITDGFTGNVFLKTAEGIASLILDQMVAKIPKNQLQALGKPFFDLQKHLHYATYQGALLLGVKGKVIKCHSYSTPQAFVNAVHGAFF